MKTYVMRIPPPSSVAVVYENIGNMNLQGLRLFMVETMINVDQLANIKTHNPTLYSLLRAYNPEIEDVSAIDTSVKDVRMVDLVKSNIVPIPR